MSAALRQIAFAIALVGAMASSPASAGEDGELVCSSSKAANDLVGCDHCSGLKALLSDAPQYAIEMGVYDLAGGVVVRLDAADGPSDVFVSRMVNRVWGVGAPMATAQTASFCDLCLRRSRKLQTVDRDYAETEHGAIVVMMSPDIELIAWLREDARWQQKLLESALSSD